ncbi:MAG: 2-hydroxyacyl-CoA dehydratase family protein [Clostridiales bacterium]|nr:2-hydroxyacyl-CoA dehydratase family protein [Clostridiales bacterium]
MTVEAIYKKMHYTLEHIEDIVKEQKAAGRKVVGCLPAYTPEELIYAGGMLPIGCWGGQCVPSKAAAYLPSFACSILKSITDFTARGVYKDLDAIVMTTGCDELSCLSQIMLSLIPREKLIIMAYPRNNSKEYAVKYLVEEFKRVQAGLEAACDVKITCEALHNAIDIYNNNRMEMQRFTSVVAAKPGLVSARDRHAVIKARFFMDKAEHTLLMKELNDQLEATPIPEFTGKKVYLAGITAEPEELLAYFDELNIAVVGDELAQESRQFRTLVPQGLDEIERLARQWQNHKACSFLHDINKARANHILKSVMECGADGMIYCQMKFCEMEEYDYPHIRDLVSEKVPVMMLDIDQNVSSYEQVRTRLQAFAEQLIYTT